MNKREKLKCKILNKELQNFYKRQKILLNIYISQYNEIKKLQDISDKLTKLVNIKGE